MIGFNDNNIARIETIDQLGRLRGNNDLNPSRQGSYQPSDDVYRIWMEPKFGFVNDQDVRQVLFGLQQQRYESQCPQHPIR